MSEELFSLSFDGKTVFIPTSQMDSFCAPQRSRYLVLTTSESEEAVAYPLPRHMTCVSYLSKVLQLGRCPKTTQAQMMARNELWELPNVRVVTQDKEEARKAAPKGPSLPKGPKPKSVYAYKLVSVASDGSKVYKFHRKWDTIKEFINRARADMGIKALPCALYTSCRTHHTAYGFLWREEYLGEEITIPTPRRTTRSAETDTDNFEADPLF